MANTHAEVDITGLKRKITTAISKRGVMCLRISDCRNERETAGKAQKASDGMHHFPLVYCVLNAFPQREC